MPSDPKCWPLSCNSWSTSLSSPFSSCARQVSQLARRLSAKLNFPTSTPTQVIQAVTTYKTLQPFVSATLLPRLINKKVWETGPLWEGFVRCAKVIAPHSFAALLQLPKEQLKDVVEKQPTMQGPLREYVKQSEFRPLFVPLSHSAADLSPCLAQRPEPTRLAAQRCWNRLVATTRTKEEGKVFARRRKVMSREWRQDSRMCIDAIQTKIGDFPISRRELYASLTSKVLSEPSAPADTTCASPFQTSDATPPRCLSTTGEATQVSKRTAFNLRRRQRRRKRERLTHS